MIRYLARRLVSGIISFFIFLTLLFFVVNWITPGDYVSSFMLGLNEAQAVYLRELLGLDQPLHVQYVRWLGQLARGNLGESYSLSGLSRPVSVLIGQALPSTLLIFVVGILTAFGIGQWLGQVTAWRVPRWASGGVILSSVLLYTSFPPFLVFVLIYFLIERWKLFRLPYPETFYVRRLWLDASLRPWDVMGRMALSIFVAVAVLMLLGWFVYRVRHRRIPLLLHLYLFISLLLLWWTLGGYLPLATDVIVTAWIPILAFVLLAFGDTALIMRATMLETQHDPYVLTARAKGLRERHVQQRHVARNAYLPVLSRLVVNLPYLMTGIVIVERAAGWPGLGNALFEAVEARQTPVYMGIMVLVGFMTLLARLALELAYALLDPRIGFERERARSFGGGSLSWLAGLDLSPSRWWDNRFTRRARRRAATRNARQNWIVFRRNRLAMFGLFLIAIFVTVAVAYPLLRATVWSHAMYNPIVGYDFELAPHPNPPSSRHMLGTDTLGRDVASVLLAATLPTFAVGIMAALSTATIGLMAASLAAYYRGRVDTIISAISDAFLLLPAPIFMIVVSVLFLQTNGITETLFFNVTGQRFEYGLRNVVGSLEFGLLYGVIAGLGSATIILRSQALKVMSLPFVEASRVSGAGAANIIVNHLIPHLAPLAALYMMITVTGAVVADGFLTFMGAGLSRTNWGNMIYLALELRSINMAITWHVLLPAAMAISLFAAAFYMVSRGLQAVLEPRLRDDAF